MLVAVVALFATTAHAFPSYDRPQEEEHKGYVINVDGAHGNPDDSITNARLCTQLRKQFRVIRKGKADTGFLVALSPLLEVTRGRFYDALTITSFLLSKQPDLEPVRELFENLVPSLEHEVAMRCGVKVPEEVSDKLLNIVNVVDNLGLADDIGGADAEVEEEEGDGEDDMGKFPINLRTVGGKKRQKKPDRFVRAS